MKKYHPLPTDNDNGVSSLVVGGDSDCGTTTTTTVRETKDYISWKVLDGKQDKTVIGRFVMAPLTVGKELFLPLDYPQSVREGYLEYQLYDSLQGLCSYLRGVLCSAQVLQAAGVGNDNATAWGAALTWALKDGMGMIGGLAFSYLASPFFDAHVKEFRLFADLINDVGLTLDMLAPYCNNLLLVSSASTLCKTLCGMSAAATKASITVYFAVEGNMADLNAKESTQETLVSLIGMLCGVTLARWLQDYEQTHPNVLETIQWSVFIVLTALHVWANWQGVCILRLQSLNRERAEIVLAPLLQVVLSSQNHTGSLFSSSFPPPPPHDQLKDTYRRMEFAKPTDVNESLLTSTWKMIFPGKLCLNCTLDDIVQTNPPSTRYLHWCLTQQRLQYIVSVRAGGGSHPFQCVQVCLLQGATNLDQLQAFCHAQLLVKGLKRIQKSKQGKGGGQRQDHTVVWETLSMYYGQIVQSWFMNDNDPSSSEQSNQASISSFLLPTQLAQAGWDIQGRLYLGFSRVRTEVVLKQD
jgi:hypothetical protein